jgi:hypothetical protein
MTNKEFNLSDKMVSDIIWVKGSPMIHIEDVKEFIRLLKERLLEDEFCSDVCEQLGGCLEHKKCIEIKIDKLAGQRLIE